MPTKEAGQKPIRHFTRQDHIDGKCDENGVAIKAGEEQKPETEAPAEEAQTQEAPAEESQTQESPAEEAPAEEEKKEGE